MARYFMHTIDRRPAFFHERSKQIVFAEVLPHWQDEYVPVLLRSSVAEIKADQQRTVRYRKRMGFTSTGEYGYVIVELPGVATAKPSKKPATRKRATKRAKG